MHFNLIIVNLPFVKIWNDGHFDEFFDIVPKSGSFNYCIETAYKKPFVQLPQPTKILLDKIKNHFTSAIKYLQRNYNLVYAFQ